MASYIGETFNRATTEIKLGKSISRKTNVPPDGENLFSKSGYNLSAANSVLTKLWLHPGSPKNWGTPPSHPTKTLPRFANERVGLKWPAF